MIRAIRNKLVLLRRSALRFFSRDAYVSGKIFETERKFTSIYTRNTWGNDESRSGSGSTLSFTRGVRQQLPAFFDRHNVLTVFDGGCGDFNWMKNVLPHTTISYIGGDIVRPLVATLQPFENSRTRFIHFDLIRQVPPKADLMMLRDVLFHLSYADTKSVLENFVKSNIPLLLTTTHDNSAEYFENSDINSGHWRLIDLFSTPYCFPANPIEALEDWSPPEPKRYMCLWDRKSIAAVLNRNSLQSAG